MGVGVKRNKYEAELDEEDDDHCRKRMFSIEDDGDNIKPANENRKGEKDKFEPREGASGGLGSGDRPGAHQENSAIGMDKQTDGHKEN